MSQEFKGYSYRGVDGNTKNHYFLDHTCTHTEAEEFPWWGVDLGAIYEIAAVKITNRGDGFGRCTEITIYDFLFGWFYSLLLNDNSF